MKNFENKQQLNFNPSSSHQTMGHDFIVGNASQSVVEEKVAHLSLQLNQIIIKPYLQQALDYLKSSKFDAINAYNRLSDQIGNEVRIISQNIDELTAKINSCQQTINRTQEIIRNKYSNATEEEISSGQLNLEYEYNIVAEHYELSLQLSQEISKYKSRIENLLATQGMLDDSSVPAVNRIQLEVDNLELLLHNLDSTDYAEALAKKQGRKNIAEKKNERKQALTGRQEALADYAQKISQNAVMNINEINRTPDITKTERYEDPNGLSINREKYPFDSYPNTNIDYDNDKQVKTSKKKYSHRNSEVQDEYINDGILLSREEMRMQKKLYKQQKKLQKMQLRNDYQQRIDAVKAEEKYLNDVNSSTHQNNKKPLLFANKKEKVPTGRFANIEEEESQIARVKSQLDNYSDYLSHEIDKQRAFDKEVNDYNRSIKVIR